MLTVSAPAPDFRMQQPYAAQSGGLGLRSYGRGSSITGELSQPRQRTVACRTRPLSEGGVVHFFLVRSPLSPNGSGVAPS